MINSYSEYVQSLKQVEVMEVASLSEEIMWTEHNNVLWQAREFLGSPGFYPVYRLGGYYSYSLLALLVYQGRANLSAEAVQAVNSADFSVLPPSLNIDAHVARVGAKLHSDNTLTNSDEFVRKAADGLRAYVSRIEEQNPRRVNAILCGGKDSLNLLLLPWKNPVLVISAQPNYPLVKEFIEKNGLAWPIICLEDRYQPDAFADEVAAACCRIDLQHWRWTAHLREIAEQHDRNLIFWKGQMADLYMSPKWLTYQLPESRIMSMLQKAYGKLGLSLPFIRSYSLDSAIARQAFERAWLRGAVMQGAHLAFIRELTGCLTLSAYHGSELNDVWARASLPDVAWSDVRPQVGQLLKGDPVHYPHVNPAPSPSSFRQGLHSVDNFVRVLRDNGIEVFGD